MTMASDLAELRAEVSALRALVLTMAPMVFGQEGISAENVEALGAAFANQIQGINIEGADPDVLQRMRDLKAGAVADLFSDAADQVRAGGDEEPDFGG
ncbi:hypothetical protein CRT23_26205 [Methylobacterium sp. V23]|jgi:hypothetical protein|nr:hypothetical protein CRT23_26205 [Methylobacterium sp. V23]